MKPFNLQEARANKPFEVYFDQLGWVSSRLLKVRYEEITEVFRVQVSINSLDTHDTEWFELPSERLRMKDDTL